MKTPQEQLNEAAEKYAKKEIDDDCEITKIYCIKDFKAGALSPEAAIGCNKHVEKAILKAQLACLDRAKDLDILTVYNELQTKLNQLEQ